MKFSESWLREWTNPAITSQALQAQLTMAGLEVDDVAPVADEFSNIVVGRVIECRQHPDADKLQVTKVDVGEGELLDIVCGAANCRQGLKVAVAKVGAVLPGNFKIKKAKLRGQPSHGMLCAEAEMGMAESSDGIIELPQDAPVGTDIRDYLQLDDVTIDVDLTANRADCLGIAGIAREVAVLNRCEVTEPAWQPVDVTIDDRLSITLVANEQCPRYLGRVIRGIDPGATTPLWMVEKLRRCGVRAIDPVVDVTNYVLLELGHPMHAFDLGKVDGEIIVRMANAGEPLTLLDGNEVKLNDDTLVIADANKALAMAGIFGGLESGVTADSRDIFLESAFFAPLAIAGRARSYGLHTDASHRYERGVDPQLQHKAMERATALLIEIVGGQAGPVVEAVSEAHLPQTKAIELRRSRIQRLLGITLSDEDVEQILTRLGLSIEANEAGWSAISPSYRFDLRIEEDLIEELARVYGYNNIPNVTPSAALAMSTHREAELPLAKVRDVLVSRGFQEAITYSFVDPKSQALLFPALEGKSLPHPISADMSVMRVSLWPGLLQAVSHNQKRQQPRVRLFETGLRFYPDDAAEHGVRQERVVSAVITGGVSEEHWTLDNRAVDFFDLKGDLEALIENTASVDEFEFKPTKISALHPGQGAEIFRDGVSVGHLGVIHPQFEKALGLNGKTIVFEIKETALLNRQLPDAKALSKFPANRRDIALVVRESVNAKDVIKMIRKVGANQLVGVNLFDVYRGKGVEEGFKSLAIALTLQDATRTLEEKEIVEAVDTVVNAAKDTFDALLRD